MAGYTWTELVPKFKIEPEDLPLSHGANVVVIARVEFEKKEDKRKKGEFYNQVDLYLHGWNVPLRLNQTKIKQLRDMFGDDINNAQGKKIALTIIVDNDDKGNPRPAINIHPYAVPIDTPPAPIPLRLAVQTDHARREAAFYGIEILGNNGETRAITPVPSPGPDWSKLKTLKSDAAPQQSNAAPVRTGEPIGLSKALEVYKTLHKRGRNKGDLIAHVGKSDMKLASQMSDVPASEWPDIVLDHARAYCGGLPATVQLESSRIETMQKELDADLAAFYQRREDEARTAGDRKLNNAVSGKGDGLPVPPDDDDIPF